jgi:hypothetical protein
MTYRNVAKGAQVPMSSDRKFGTDIPLTQYQVKASLLTSVVRSKLLAA